MIVKKRDVMGVGHPEDLMVEARKGFWVADEQTF